MSDISFDDLIPQQQNGVSFTDLIPQGASNYRPEGTPTENDIKDYLRARAVEQIPGYGALRAMPHMLYGAAQAPMAISQLASRAIPGGLWGSIPPEQVDAAKGQLDSYYKSQFNPDNSVGAALAQGVGSAIGPGVVAGKALPAAATWLGRAAQGTGIGAAQGALTPTTGNGDFGTEKINQITSGAKWGVGTSIGLDAAGRALAPVLSPELRALTDAGINPTIGQRSGGALKALEEKATSIPLLGDLIKYRQSQALDQFNRGIYNKVLEPLGVTYEGPVGQKALGKVQSIVSEAYDSTLAKSVPASPALDQQFGAGITQLASMVPLDKRGTFIDTLKQQFEKRLTPTGTLTPSNLKAMDSELGQLARDYRGGRGSDEALSRAYQQAAFEVRAMYARANPSLKAEMDAANSAYAGLVQLQSAAQGTKVARNEGVVTPADYLKGILKGDKSVRDNAFSKGEMRNQDFAQTADQVLSSKYPDSGTAGRAMVGAIGAGGLGYLSPLALGGASLAALPYLPGTRALFSANRPAAMRQLGESLPSYIPYLTPAVAGGLLSGQ